jgi:hypothetical protein
MPCQRENQSLKQLRRVTGITNFLNINVLDLSIKCSTTFTKEQFYIRWVKIEVLNHYHNHYYNRYYYNHYLNICYHV